MKRFTTHSLRKGAPLSKLNFFDYSLPKLQAFVEAHGFKKFSATQLFEWVYLKNEQDFNNMTNLSLKSRDFFAATFAFPLPEVVQEHISSDGTIKLLVALSDGNLIETVLMRYNYGNVVCVTDRKSVV